MTSVQEGLIVLDEGMNIRRYGYQAKNGSFKIMEEYRLIDDCKNLILQKDTFQH